MPADSASAVTDVVNTNFAFLASRWSARSGARTNELDAGDEWRRLRDEVGS
jgi:hypothetical protein